MTTPVGKHRGYLRKRGGTWYYSVYGKSGRVVLSDNTNSYEKMMAACRRDVAAVRRVEGAGHKLRPYSELVDEAMNKL